jgi:hypothetical protein
LYTSHNEPPPPAAAGGAAADVAGAAAAGDPVAPVAPDLPPQPDIASRATATGITIRLRMRRVKHPDAFQI